MIADEKVAYFQISETHLLSFITQKSNKCEKRNSYQMELWQFLDKPLFMNLYSSFYMLQHFSG